MKRRLLRLSLMISLLVVMTTLTCKAEIVPANIKEGEVSRADIGLIDLCTGSCPGLELDKCLDQQGNDMRYIGGSVSGIKGIKINEMDSSAYEYVIDSDKKYLHQDTPWTCAVSADLDKYDDIEYEAVYNVAIDTTNSRYDFWNDVLGIIKQKYEDSKTEDDPDGDLSILEDQKAVEEFLKKANHFRQAFTKCEIEGKDVWLKNSFYGMDLTSVHLFSISSNGDLVVVNRNNAWLWQVWNTESPEPPEKEEIVEKKEYLSQLNYDLVLVCSECSKCSQDGCRVDGSLIGECGAGDGYYMSKGCADHACLFVLNHDVQQGDHDKIEEKLTCQELNNGEGCSVCNGHKCKICTEPICTNVGEYTKEGPSWILESGDEGQFSPYCQNHMCNTPGCDELAPSNNTSVVSDLDEHGNIVIDASGFHCFKHNRKCQICQKELAYTDYQASGGLFHKNCEGDSAILLNGGNVIIEKDNKFVYTNTTEGVTRVEVNGKTVIVPAGSSITFDKLPEMIEENWVPEIIESSDNSREEGGETYCHKHPDVKLDSNGKCSKCGSSMTPPPVPSSASSSGSSKPQCDHKTKTIKYNNKYHWQLCKECNEKLNKELHTYATANSYQCTACPYYNPVEEENKDVVELKKLLNITGTKYDAIVKENIWTRELVEKLVNAGVYIDYEIVDKNVDVKTYLQLLAKVVRASGAYKDLDPKNFESLPVRVYPEWPEEYSEDYEFIMLAYGNAFGDNSEEQGKGMYDTLFGGYFGWLDKSVTRCEMMSLASALFDYSDNPTEANISDVHENFAPYIRKAITSGWYIPYKQNGKTATLNNLYLTEEVDIFNTYAFLARVYDTLMNDQTKFNGFIKDAEHYSTLYKEEQQDKEYADDKTEADKEVDQDKEYSEFVDPEESKPVKDL